MSSEDWVPESTDEEAQLTGLALPGSQSIEPTDKENDLLAPITDPDLKAKIQKMLERANSRNDILQEQIVEANDAARSEAVLRVQAEGTLTRVSDLVEGGFRVQPIIGEMALRLWALAYSATHDIDAALGLLEGKKTSPLVYIVAIALLGFFALFVVNPVYSVPAADWLSGTIIGNVMLVALCFVGVLVAWRFLR